EELPETVAVGGGWDAAAFFASLLPQIYVDQQYVPHTILAPLDFADRDLLEEVLSERRERRVEILVPQRGEKRSLVDLAARNAKQSFEQRFRVLKPQVKVMQQALQDALELPALPTRIECFDISHIQGAETVASMVVWEEVIYVFGQVSEPVVIDHHSPILHVVQMVRDEAHRFAVTFHRKRRQMRDRSSELLEIPGIGQQTRKRLLQHFGSLRAVQQAD